MHHNGWMYEKRYLDKLRRNYPNRDIPTDDVVKNALTELY